MELRSLRYFVVAAEEKNITHAAERLHMSQPPLSHQIMQLEEELGTPVFIRGKRKLTLTAEGEVLFRRAKEILELEQHAVREIKELKNGIAGTLYLGTVEGRAPYLASCWISGFREEFPNVQYSLWNGSTDDVMERVRKGLADAAIIALPYDTEHFESISVGKEPWSAIIPKSHRLAADPKKEITLKELSGEPLIVPARASRIDAIRSWFAESKSEANLICATSNYLDAAALTEAGVGISIFPQTTDDRSELTVTKVIASPRREVEYALIWKKGTKLNELTEVFIQFVRDYLEEEKLDKEV